MPDIAMCQNRECPIRGTCYRYLAKPLWFQTYSDYRHGDDGCSYWWEIGTEKVRTLAEVDAGIDKWRAVRFDEYGQEEPK